MRRLNTSSAALLALLSSALAPASPSDPLVLDPTHSVRFDERGVWRLESDKGVLLTQCGLRLWAASGFLTQADARPAEPPADGPAGRTFHGVLRVGGKPVEYWQTATPVPGGLLVQYAIAAGLADADEAAAGFELPVATFIGGTCTIAGGQPVTLPADKPAEPRLVERAAAALAVERNGLAISIQRRPAGRIIVQDGRQWNNPCFQAHLYARRAVGDPEGWRSITFLLSLGKPAGGPVIAAVLPGKEAVPCHEIHEAEVLFWAPYANPYRDTEVRLWAEVTAPSGRRPDAQGFYCRDYARSREGDAEVLTPVGHGRWRLRITPTEPGAYSCVVKAATPAGTAASKPFTFTASASNGQRFLHPATHQTRYLEFASGESCFLIGHNYGWPPAKALTYGADAALARMASAKLNATRLWLCSWGIHIEGTRPDDYRLDDAWRLDHFLAEAHRHGIYVQLCLDNANDLAAKDNAASNPYLVANGGPCSAPAQFFTLPAAREQYRRRLSYLAARYAPFASVVAWELFNELDCATGKPQDPALVAWAKESAAHLKTLDPHRRAVTLGVGLSAGWDELWRLDEIDLATAHAYIHRPIDATRPSELDAAALVLEQRDALAPYGKPIAITEFGFMGTREFNPLNEADKTGVHLHNALWASALGGCAASAMHWWWDSYIAQRDLYYHFTALERFLRNTPLPGPEWAAVQSKGNSPIRIVGLKTGSEALLWVQQRENTWSRRVLEQREPVPLGRATIELPRLRDGRYRVEWWDTYGGQPVTHADVVTADGTLVLRVPPRFPDIACKIRRLAD